MNDAASPLAGNRILATDLLVDYPVAEGIVHALDCPRLEVDGGTSLAVMGPSGCGKSTLLGLLAGLALPTQGSVTIGSETVSSYSERDRVRFRRRSLGMVYQADNLLPHLTVEENIGLQAAICRESAPAGREVDEPQELLARLGMAELAARLPDKLSGGQRQRAAVARAIVHRPAVLLADEPTGSLDAASATRVVELLVDVQRAIGATLVMVTHDPAIAAYLDRTVHLPHPASRLEPNHAG